MDHRMKPYKMITQSIEKGFPFLFGWVCVKYEDKTDGCYGHIQYHVPKGTYRYGNNNGAYCWEIPSCSDWDLVDVWMDGVFYTRGMVEDLIRQYGIVRFHNTIIFWAHGNLSSVRGGCT